MQLISSFLCIAILFVESLGQESSNVKLVYTNQGPIRGYRSENFDVYEFYSIPYATAPVGVNKFKAPLPPPTWTDIFNATDRKIICPQPQQHNHMNIENFIQTEDCLVANVFIPSTLNTENCTINCDRLPVLVIVHGGAYLVGHGNELSPKVLVNSQQIVAVTFNYRLNVHGFLCLGTDVAPGNAGMKDQVALLRWVKDNIARFGGDPNRITISGCSAGGAAVDTLTLSPTTNGLLNQVISESGCSLNTFSIQMDPVKNAFDHATAFLNYTGTNDTNALSDFYAALSAESLANSIIPLMDVRNGYFLFHPCVERNLGQERFLSEAPIEILRNGSYIKVPTLYGFADMEGILRLEHFDSWKNEMNTAFWNFLPVDLKFENEQQRDLVASSAKQFYFNGSVDVTNELDFINYMTDFMFVHSIMRVVSLQVEAGNDRVYLYEYGFVHNNSFPLSGDARGAIHCEQMATAYGGMPTEGIPSEEFWEMADKMGQIYLNFILTGNPTPNVTNWPVWPAVNSNVARTPYYLIRNTTEVVDANNTRDFTQRMEFWDQIYRDHDIRLPVPPNAANLMRVAPSTLLLAIFFAIFCLK